MAGVDGVDLGLPRGPQARVPLQPLERQPTGDGKGLRRIGLEREQRAEEAATQARLPWLSITAFGWPVVPEV